MFKKITIVILFLILVILLAPTLANNHESEQSNEYISTEFDSKGVVIIGKEKFYIPTYLPYNSSKNSDQIYTVVKNGSINLDKVFHVEFGLTKNCYGENVCDSATFSYEEISENLIGDLDNMLTLKADVVTLQNNIEGYYIPSSCYSYCNEIKLIWFYKGKVFILGSRVSKNKEENIIELKKSANSYIELLSKLEKNK